VVMFDPDPRFHFTASDTGSSAWIDLMPSKSPHHTWGNTSTHSFSEDGGIVSIDEPQKYHLPTSYKNRTNPHAEVYSMSMYHQLHCLVTSSPPICLLHVAKKSRTPYASASAFWKASSMLLKPPRTTRSEWYSAPNHTWTTA
jgi:hypothetical protein